MGIEPMTFQNIILLPLLNVLSYQARWEWAVGIIDLLFYHMTMKR